MANLETYHLRCFFCIFPKVFHTRNNAFWKWPTLLCFCHKTKCRRIILFLHNTFFMKMDTRWGGNIHFLFRIKKYKKKQICRTINLCRLLIFVLIALYGVGDCFCSVRHLNCGGAVLYEKLDSIAKMVLVLLFLISV